MLVFERENWFVGAMTSSPLVTTVTALYNSEAFVAETVRSVIAQTVSEWEMVIVDDASTDGSKNVVKELLKTDKRLRLICLENNAGSAVARNTAIEAARGRYIAFLDSDDQWHPSKLEKQITFMESNSCGFSHTYYEKVTESGERTEEIVKPPRRLSYVDMLKSNQVGCLSAVYDSGRLGKRYMPLIRKRQDYGLWLDLLKDEQYVHCLPESLALYRIRPGSISRNKLEMMRYNWELYRNVEGFSLPRTAYYLGWNIVRKVIN